MPGPESRTDQRDGRRMKDRCQPEVAFSGGQQDKCQMPPPSPLSTFSSFSSPHLPLNLTMLLCSTTRTLQSVHFSLRSVRLPRAAPLVIFLPLMTERNGDVVYSFSMVSAANRDGAETPSVCVCVCVYVCVCGNGC